MSDGLWFRLNGDFAEHPKVIDLSDRAFRLYISGLCYTARNLTDGFLSDRAVKVVCALCLAQRRHIVELRDAGLWIVNDDGFDVKDYLIYNPSAETMKGLRDQRREAGRKGGLESGKTRRANKASGEANASSKREAVASPAATKHVTELDVEPKAVRAGDAESGDEQPQVLDFKITTPTLREMPAA